MKNVFLVSILAFLVAACQQGNYYDNQNTYRGAGLGAVVGGVAGALTGKGSTDRRQRAMIGAGIGALAGGGVGAYMDEQEAQLRRSLSGKGVVISRQGDKLLLTMPDNITFDSNSSSLKSQFSYTLADVADVLNHYNQTSVRVIGHTDSDGSDAYNQTLSEKRAKAVASAFRANGISGSRIFVIGAGESQPIASNSTASGKAQNRRVEVQISPVQESSFFGM